MIDGVALPLAIVGGLFVMFVFYSLIRAFTGFIRFVTFVVLLPWYLIKAIVDIFR